MRVVVLLGNLINYATNAPLVKWVNEKVFAPACDIVRKILLIGCQVKLVQKTRSTAGALLPKATFLPQLPY